TTSTIDQGVALKENDEVLLEAVFHILINGTAQFVDGSSEGAAVRFAKGVDVSGLVPNTKYMILATKAADYNGLKQFNGIAYKEIEGGAPIVPIKYTGALSNTELAKLLNNIIAVEDLTVSVAPVVSSTGVLTYTLKNAAGDSMAVREHQTNAAAINAILALDLKVGDKVNVTSIVISWFNAPQFINGFLEKVTLDPVVEFNNSVTRLENSLPETDTVIYRDFELPTTFENLAIVWTVVEGEAALSLEGGKATITRLAEPTTVKLSGAVKEGDHEATVTVQVVIAKEGEEEPLPSIAEIFAKPKDTEVSFRGVVSGFTAYNSEFKNYDKVWLEDETGSITVYRGTFPSDLAVGDKYLVSGKMADFSGLVQVAQGSTLTLVNRGNALIDSKTITDLSTLKATDQASRINLSGEVVSVSATGREMVVKVGEKNITVRTTSDLVTDPINAKLLEGIVGQTVNLKDIHVDWHNGAQLLPTVASQIEFIKVEDDELVHMAIVQLIEQFKDKSFEMETAVELPTKLLGVDLVWTIDPENAIKDGKWMTVTEDTNITLSVVGTLNDAEDSSGNMTVTIKIPVEGQTYKETFNSITVADLTGYSGSYKFDGVGGSKWDIVARTNMDAYAIDKQGFILRQSSDNGYIKVTLANGFLAFSFEYRKSWTGANAREYKVDITNNGVTVTYDIPKFGAGSGAQDNIYTWNYDGPALTGEVVVKIYTVGASGNQATFDNFTWTE
ncbi:MAG: hypothetical protein GX787_07810, partial [Tissierellia bacterium]|nr:hypothetical protein [Tissierellia bacterium]